MQLFISVIIWIHLSSGIKANWAHVGPGPAKGVISFAGFYEVTHSVFMQKPQKTPKVLVEKRDRELYLVPLIYQFSKQSRYPYFNSKRCF